MQNEDEPENTRGVSSLEPRNLHPPPLSSRHHRLPFYPHLFNLLNPHDWNRIPKKEEEEKKFFWPRQFRSQMVWSPFPIR